VPHNFLLPVFALAKPVPEVSISLNKIENKVFRVMEEFHGRQFSVITLVKLSLKARSQMFFSVFFV
jgi:hypothetical protein